MLRKITDKISKDILLSLVSGLLLILAFPKADLGYLAWVALVPLVLSIKDKNPRQAFKAAYLAGFVFFLVTLWWLGQVTVLGLFALVGYLALYFGLFGFLFAVSKILLKKVNNLIWITFIACLWVSLEYLRSRLFGGFGWAVLGYSQYRQTLLIQASDIFGVYGISFAIVFVNITLAQLIALRNVKRKEFSRLIYAVVIVFIVLLGYSFLRTRSPLVETNFKAAVIQGNISLAIKEDSRTTDYILEKYRKLTGLAALEKVDLAIWPETTIPGYLASDEKIFLFVNRLAREKNIFLLTGAIRCDTEGSYYNSAMLLSAEGDIIQCYDKLHLVPFGEYIPLRGSFLFKPLASKYGDFTRGRDYTIFQIAKPSIPDQELKFGVLICFEDVFAHLARGFAQKGAQFLIVITNDVWFGDTAAAYQHLQASVFRAVENKVMVARAANTGISCFITPYGQISNVVPAYHKKKTFVEGQSVQNILLASRSTLYHAWGNWFAYLCGLVNIIGFGLPFIRRK